MTAIVATELVYRHSSSPPGTFIVNYNISVIELPIFRGFHYIMSAVK